MTEAYLFFQRHSLQQVLDSIFDGLPRELSATELKVEGHGTALLLPRDLGFFNRYRRVIEARLPRTPLPVCPNHEPTAAGTHREATPPAIEALWIL
jgi:hypothetical protein